MRWFLVALVVLVAASGCGTMGTSGLLDEAGRVRLHLIPLP